MAYQQSTAYPTPDQAAYQAGYDAGFRAGYQAGLGAQQHHEQQGPAAPPYAYQHSYQQQYHPQQPPSQPPQLPHRPAPPASQQHPAPDIPPRPAPPPPPSAVGQQIPPPPPPSTRPIWQPRTGTTFNYVLSHPIKLSDATHPLDAAEVFIVDLFETPAASVAALHALGRKVVAYFSAGTAEDWRADVRGIPKGEVGGKMDGWAGERWVDVRGGGGQGGGYAWTVGVGKGEGV